MTSHTIQFLGLQVGITRWTQFGIRVERWMWKVGDRRFDHVSPITPHLRAIHEEAVLKTLDALPTPKTYDEITMACHKARTQAIREGKQPGRLIIGHLQEDAIFAATVHTIHDISAAGTFQFMGFMGEVRGEDHFVITDH